MTVRTKTCVLSLAAILIATAAEAPPQHEPVDAPYAQQLLERAMITHPEVWFIGIHVVPPGGAHNLIIASSNPAKIGDVSTDADMEFANRKLAKAFPSKNRSSWEVDEWLADSAGKTIGMIVFHLSNAAGGSEAEVLAIATALRDDMQRQIPSTERLFGEPEGQVASRADTITLRGVDGHFDHFGADPDHNRLFATLQAMGAVYVVDMRSNQVIGMIKGIGKPHAVFYLPDLDRIYITDGNHDHGKLHIVDGKTFSILKTVDLMPGTEQIAYDPRNKYLYVANGGRDANLPYAQVSAVDTTSGKKMADFKVNTTGLEAIQQFFTIP